MQKTKPFILLLCLAICIALPSCNNSDDSDDPMPQRTFQDVEADFQALDLSPGVQDVSLLMPDGTFFDFRFIAPERAAGENRPMILTLHGASTSPDAHKNTACYAEPGLDTLNAFILSPFGGEGLWYQDLNQEVVGTLIFLARKFWPIEQDKIAVTGFSNGGNGSWFYGQFQSSTLSAAIPMASSYDLYLADSSVVVFDIPIYVIHGENDELFPIDATRGWVEATNDAGSDVTFVEATGLGHYTPCDYTPYLKEAAVWLKETVWME